MRAELSDVQRKIYGFIEEHIRSNNYPPTIKEIQDNFGYKSNNSVVIHIRKLKEKGYLTNKSEKGKMSARTLQLVDDVMGYHTIDSEKLSQAIADLKSKGHAIPVNAVIELLAKLDIRIE